MKKQVVIEEVLRKLVTVNADSNEEAVKDVKKDYIKEEIILDSDDLHSITIKCGKYKEELY